MNTASTPPDRRVWLTRNVVVLGVVSLLTDASSEMIIPLLPLFLTSVLGAGALAVGWIEGLAEALSSVLKLLAGRWSDRSGRRRPFVLAGYGLSALARPLIGFAAAPWHVLAVRLVDRTGKGLRTSPRDALLAAAADPQDHASVFGFHRAMDHTGAVLGPLLAVAALAWWSADLRTVFWLAAIPGTACMAVLAFGVRETLDAPVRVDAAPRPATPDSSQPQPVAPPIAPARPPQLWRLIVPLGLFTLGNASDVFLLLKAGEARAPITTLPLLWMALHVVKTFASLAGGRLADRVGRRRVLAAGWLVYAAIYAGFAFARTEAEIAALFVVYGLYHGLSEGPEKALVAELAPRTKWGAAFGAYHLTLGLLALVASVAFGALWDAFGSRVAFLTSASIALAAVLCLGLLAAHTTNSSRTVAN